MTQKVLEPKKLASLGQTHHSFFLLHTKMEEIYGQQVQLHMGIQRTHLEVFIVRILMGFRYVNSSLISKRTSIETIAVPIFRTLDFAIRSATSKIGSNVTNKSSPLKLIFSVTNLVLDVERRYQNQGSLNKQKCSQNTFLKS